MPTTDATTPTTPNRQRVLAALAHREPDRVPIDCGSTGVTGIHVSCVAALRDHYGLEKRPVKIHEPYQMLGLVEEVYRVVGDVGGEGGAEVSHVGDRLVAEAGVDAGTGQPVDDAVRVGGARRHVRFWCTAVGV